MLGTALFNNKKVNFMTLPSHSLPSSYLYALTKSYALLILTVVALTPTVAIVYLYFFQAPIHYFEHHIAHEVAIAISLLQGSFITYVTYRCYQNNQELFLRWLTLGFMGFTVIYSMHGLFTRLSHDHMMLFVLYGSASRLVMAGCLLMGLINYSRHEQPTPQAASNSFWLISLSVFMVINALLALLSSAPWAGAANTTMEIVAMMIMLSCAMIIIMRSIRSPLMLIYTLSVIFFAQSSLAFLLSQAWSHMFWLAHAIFAAGFMALSYGVIQAFHTTGSFSRVYSHSELIDQVRAEKARTDDALLKLQRAHEALEVSAATDSLTGCANRREFEARGKSEVARAERSAAALSLVTIDLDHFKQINDNYGHKGGDDVLRAFAALIKKILRPSDLAGRIGGEEFALILPDTTINGAATVAERLRQLVESEVVDSGGKPIRFTASIGVAQYGPDGDSYEAVIEAADKRMYRAKQAGRNQVVCTEP